MRCLLSTALSAALVLSPAMAVGQDGSASRRERAVVKRALKLLPAPAPVPIALIDPDLAGDPAAVRRLDAFVVREPNGQLRQKVYLNQKSELLQAAVRGSDFHITLLSAVIYHELAHLRGLDEPAAARAERDYFETLIARGLVSQTGIAYLHTLRRH